jgi:hypothetical protein
MVGAPGFEPGASCARGKSRDASSWFASHFPISCITLCGEGDVAPKKTLSRVLVIDAAGKIEMECVLVPVIEGVPS